MNKKGKRLSNEKQKNKHKNNKKLIIVIIHTISQTNMDCVNSYWLNWIKWNEYCENDSIEIIRSVFIRNMWFLDLSLKNQSCIVKIQSKNGFNKHKERKISIYLNSEHNLLLEYAWWLDGDYSMLIPHWLALMWLIDMDFYNNREEDCYAIQYNDRLQLIQWSNKTVSWFSIDSIAKLSPRIHREYNVFQWLFHLDSIESIAWYYPSIGYYQWTILSIVYH